VKAAAVPVDLRLVLHDTLPRSFQGAQVLLARAGLDGTLQLLTSGWARALGYASDELDGKMLRHLMWSDARRAAAAAVAILDEQNMQSVELRVRCGDGAAKSFRLHRHYDSYEHIMYFMAEETVAKPAAASTGRIERRATVRQA
jgi:PAS domain S-box-containing protein